MVGLGLRKRRAGSGGIEVVVGMQRGLGRVYRGWVGGFVRGQVRGENFVVQFGVEIFPTKCFCTIWGSSCSLCILRVHPLCGMMKMLPWYSFFSNSSGGTPNG